MKQSCIENIIPWNDALNCGNSKLRLRGGINAIAILQIRATTDPLMINLLYYGKIILLDTIQSTMIDIMVNTRRLEYMIRRLI